MGERGTVLQIASMVPPARYGGAERVVQSFADELGSAGWTVENRGLRRRGHDDEPGVAIRNVYWPFDGGQPGAAARIVWHAIDTYASLSAGVVGRVIDEVAPDAIVTHNLRGWGYAPWTVAAKRGIPLIHVIHDYGLICNSSTLWRDDAPCADICTPCRPRLRYTMKRWPGGHLVGVSQAVLAEHHRHGFGDPRRNDVLHPVAAAHDSGARMRKSEPGEPKVFGYLGRLSSEKGVASLIDAVSGTDKHLVVAGDGDPGERAALQDKASDRVRWCGWVDPIELFESIDVLVVPSVWSEPFGLVVVEAARAGVPVLLADRPGLIEAAEAAGASYLTFPANDIAALRDSLARPISEYRQATSSDGGRDITDLVASAVDAKRMRRDA